MADFETLLAQIMNPGEDGIPESIYDDLSASYTESTSTRDAKLETMSADVARLQAELTATKAANWDLMQMIPQAGGTEEPTSEESESEESDDLGDDDDFFEDKDN